MANIILSPRKILTTEPLIAARRRDLPSAISMMEPGRDFAPFAAAARIGPPPGKTGYWIGPEGISAFAVLGHSLYEVLPDGTFKKVTLERGVRTWPYLFIDQSAILSASESGGGKPLLLSMSSSLEHASHRFYVRSGYPDTTAYAASMPKAEVEAFRAALREAAPPAYTKSNHTSA